jgi:hypothetical protein
VECQLATDLVEQLNGVSAQSLEVWIVGLIGGRRSAMNAGAAAIVSAPA